MIDMATLKTTRVYNAIQRAALRCWLNAVVRWDDDREHWVVWDFNSNKTIYVYRVIDTAGHLGRFGFERIESFKAYS